MENCFKEEYLSVQWKKLKQLQDTKFFLTHVILFVANPEENIFKNTKMLPNM